MRHAVKNRKLGRTTAHRMALFRNQLASLMEHGRILTTVPKAKELRPIAERLITQGRRGTVEARRRVRRWISNRGLVKKVFDEIAPRFKDRPGGYLRIVKLGWRQGDGAEMAVLEFVDYEAPVKVAEEKGRKRGRRKPAVEAAPPAQATVREEEEAPQAAAEELAEAAEEEKPRSEKKGAGARLAERLGLRRKGKPTPKVKKGGTKGQKKGKPSKKKEK